MHESELAPSALVRFNGRTPGFVAEKLMSKLNLSRPEQATSTNQALEKAYIALQMQRPDEAERLAANVLKSNRGNVPAARILGSALLAQNRQREAVDVLQRSVRRSDNPEIETLLAVALSAAGRGDDAIAQLQRTIARRPPFAPAFIELGRQLSTAGRFEDGIELLESGLVLLPDHIELRMALGYLHLKRNNRASARSTFLRVRAVAPERHDALVALAKLMILDGEYAVAADLYRHALRLRSDDGYTRINLGKCLLEVGERDAGESTLRAAAHGAPQLAGRAILALASAPYGRIFLRPSAAAKFLRVDRN